MSHTSTHTYASLPVSRMAFNEIKDKLMAAGYGEQIDHLPNELIDMNGLALIPDEFGLIQAPNDANRFGHWFLEFCADQAAWSQKTFGADNVRDPIGPLKHMLKEIQEVLDNPTDTEEYADLLLLLMDSSRRAGITPITLLQAARAKMRKNKQREWPKPTSDEPVEHVRNCWRCKNPITAECPSDGFEYTSSPPQYAHKKCPHIIDDGKGELMSSLPTEQEIQEVESAIQNDPLLSKVQFDYPSPIWMTMLMEDIQHWLDNIYADATEIPICCWSSTCTTDAISIGPLLIWESENSYEDDQIDELLSLEGCKKAFQHALEDAALPLLKDRV